MLHALLVRIVLRADTKRVLCHAVIASDLHQPLLSLLHIHPASMGSSQVIRLPSLVHVVAVRRSHEVMHRSTS